jgi:UDP-N-acetylmuramoyl-tripeptide--D-alanyl-D-alanine ligase
VYIVAILSLAATVFAVRYHMHMFQLNDYRASTQTQWLGTHPTSWFLQVFCIVGLGLASRWYLPGAIVVTVLLVLAILVKVLRKTQAKKPLKYTARVKRMLVTASILTFGLLSGVVWAPGWGKLAFAAAPYVLSGVAVIGVNIINAPIEAGVRRHYLNDAKRILAEHPNLVKIGITGSYGKTSLKYYLTTLLRGHFTTLMTPESYNTPMGITMTIRGELRATHEVFVCEMGAKKVGEIKEDCDLVNPQIGVVTAIGEQHLATFGSQEAILRTKLELADAVKGKGMLYLNGDDILLRANQPDQDRQLYGLCTDNQTYAYGLSVSTSGTVFSLNHKGKDFVDLVTPLIGGHTIQNLAGALAVALDLGVTEAELRTQLGKLVPAPHRLSMSHNGGATIIDDAYNSNPAGAKAALDTLAMFDAVKILITPGMVELGEREEALNEAFGEQAVIADHVFLVGARQTEPIARGLASAGYDQAKVTIVEDVKDAIARAYALPGESKVILLENDLPDNY